MRRVEVIKDNKGNVTAFINGHPLAVYDTMSVYDLATSLNLNNIQVNGETVSVYTLLDENFRF